MSNCLNCNVEIESLEGVKPKKYCSNKCKQAYWQKNKPAKGLSEAEIENLALRSKVEKLTGEMETLYGLSAELISLKMSIRDSGLFDFAPAREDISYHDRVVFSLAEVIERAKAQNKTITAPLEDRNRIIGEFEDKVKNKPVSLNNLTNNPLDGNKEINTKKKNPFEGLDMKDAVLPSKVRGKK